MCFLTRCVASVYELVLFFPSCLHAYHYTQNIGPLIKYFYFMLFARFLHSTELYFMFALNLLLIMVIL